MRAAVCAALLAFAPFGAARATDASAVAPGIDARWFDRGRPTAAAWEASAALLRADRDGLEPADYAALALARALSQASLEPVDDTRALEIGATLGDALLRFVGDLRAGRVVPQRVHSDFAPVDHAPLDRTGWVHDAQVPGRLAGMIDAATPPIPQYRRMREALARYRALLDGAPDHPAWAAPLPPLRGALEPGTEWSGLPMLARRLSALGDLGPDALSRWAGTASTPGAGAYGGALADAVKSFQRRHGLQIDGIVGNATLERLAVSPARRIRQIELALERLRWTPVAQARRMIAINVPEFVLRAYEVDADRFVLRARMKVIVGQALDRRTPLFDEAMRSIEFSPYWNVPASIARDEILPRLRRDPGYLAREGFEFVAPDGRIDTSVNAATLAALQAGLTRIRQRPGPRNALGDVKFVFPNASNIYLHHTPSTGLFARERRDFSHGCIRVEHPVALARFALGDMPGWRDERIIGAMAAGHPSTVRLAEPIPVLIAYGTALTVDGELRFFDDIYGQDPVLDAALREVSASRQRVREHPP
ncbi:MAG: murein L,D-transpeptidase [Lautropia sp.]